MGGAVSDQPVNFVRAKKVEIVLDRAPLFGCTLHDMEDEMLGPKKQLSVCYQGKGVGGANLPFDTVADVRAYVNDVHATGYQVWDNTQSRIIESGVRKDCRSRFTVSGVEAAS